jgi:type II restriction enzyme
MRRAAVAGKQNQMELSFDSRLADSYKSWTQRIRVLSEDWVGRQLYCPGCGRESVTRYGNNSRIADFHCSHCGENYELKSQKRPQFNGKVVDGAYGTMMVRLASQSVPSLLLLGYERQSLQVRNLMVVPRQFFVPELIEQRRALSASARRAGWVGCNIALDRIPPSGRIFLIQNGTVLPKPGVLTKWRKTLFLRSEQDLGTKGWLLSVMRCVEQIGRETFSLNEVYAREAELQATYPGNRHIRPKIRQQLQKLRDKGYLEFVGNGIYRLIS